MSAAPIASISNRTLRRFILGKQGLWPGRRWTGKAGAAQAIREIDALQIDPLVVVARAHDLILHSRVADYQPEHLDTLIHTDRQFFDYGGWLAIYPMDELPYWKLHMERHKLEKWWTDFAQQHSETIPLVRSELRIRGPLGHRDFEGKKVESYRARKDSGLVLYYLWRVGELMTANRRRFDRLYDFAENVAPAQYLQPASPEAAEAWFLQKALTMHGMSRLNEWRGMFSYFVRRQVLAEEIKQRVNEQIEAGNVAILRVEGQKDALYVSTADFPLLEALDAGRIPEAWQPLDTSTDTEVNFLAPLDMVSARGRAAKLFDFEYKWEIYTPVDKRKWGYYVLPILFGDALVGRIDVKLDRTTQTMLIKGFWLEDPTTAKNSAFAEALVRGLARFTTFHGVTKLDATAIKPAALRPAKAFKRYGITLT